MDIKTEWDKPVSPGAVAQGRSFCMVGAKC
jgi:hypothetical protein